MNHKFNAFTIIETLIAITLLAMVLTGAYKIRNDAIKAQTFSSHRSMLLLALSVIKDEEMNKKDFTLSDKLKEKYENIDDTVRRATNVRYHYARERDKEVVLGDEAKSVQVVVEKCRVSSPKMGGAGIYKIHIK